MLMLQVVFEFFKIGLFAVGGGMATIPFLQHLAESTGWFDPQLIVNMVALSEATPGPIGINMATYVGYQICGVAGGILATLGEILPSIIIVTLISRALAASRKNRLLEGAFSGLRPAVTGLIAAAGFDVAKGAIMNIADFLASLDPTVLFIWPRLGLFVAFFVAIRVFKKHPVTYIAAAAVIGIVLGL